MANASLHEQMRWEELDYRPTHYGVDIILRRNSKEGRFSILAFDSEGAQEFVLSQKKALDAFSHPSVTPGLESATPEKNPWDKALDELNDLQPEDKEWAMRNFDRVRQGYISAPTILLDSVRLQKRNRHADQAA